MKCTSCGAEFTGGSFCPHCGTKAVISAPSPTQPSQTPAQPRANYAQPQPGYTQPQANYAQPQPGYTQPRESYTNMSPAGSNPPQPAKKKSKAPLIIGIVVAVIALIAVLGLVFAGSITRSIVGETNYYLLREADTLSSVLDLDFDKYEKNDKFSVSSNIDIGADSADSDIQQLREIISKLDVKLNATVDKNDGKAMICAEANGGSQKAAIKACFSENALGITAPQLTNSSFYLDLAENALFSDGSNYKTIAKQLSGIVKEVEQEELDGCISSSREKVNGKSCRVVTYTFTEKTAMNTFAALLEKIMEDEKIMEAMEPLLQYYYKTLVNQYNMYSSDIPSYSDFLNQLKEEIKGFREEAKEADGTEKIYYRIAYSGNHIVQRTLDMMEVENEKVVIDSDVTGSEKGISFTAYSGDEVEVSGALSLVSSGSKKDLSLKVNDYDGETLANASISDYEVEKIDGVYVPLGTLAFSVPDEDVQVQLTATQEDNYRLALQVKDDYDSLLSLSLGCELSTSTDFSEYEEPSNDGTTNFNEFISSVTDGLENYLSTAIDD